LVPTRYLQSLAAVLLLAGCQQAAQEPATAENEAVPPANAPTAPAATNAITNGQAPAAESNRIPAAFHGVYDRDAAACASAGSEERLEVTPVGLHFHESIGEIRAVSAEGDRAISAEADFQGEGESWRNRLRLSLAANGDALTVTQPDGASLTRIRCP
jgi:hypothetical protein